MATLAFLGAAQQVTGSCYLIDTGRKRILLECGIRQRKDKLDTDYQTSFAFDPRSIDAMVLSHAHLDHSGLVPLLVKEGYERPTYTTTATADQLPIMYKDAASLLRSDIERRNRRLLGAGKDPVQPPYTIEDVQQALRQINGVDYGKGRQSCRVLRFGFLMPAIFSVPPVSNYGWMRGKNSASSFSPGISATAVPH